MASKWGLQLAKPDSRYPQSVYGFPHLDGLSSQAADHGLSGKYGHRAGGSTKKFGEAISGVSRILNGGEGVMARSARARKILKPRPLLVTRSLILIVGVVYCAFR